MFFPAPGWAGIIGLIPSRMALAQNGNGILLEIGAFFSYDYIIR